MHRLLVAPVTLALTAGMFLLAPAANAEPWTTVKFPTSATATRYVGQAFDTCAAPSYAAIKAWNASPYRAVGVYIGGPNRTCAQPNLTATWVTDVSRLGWRLLPIYMGRQAPCSDRVNSVKITPSSAFSQGEASANDAVTQAKAIGILPGSVIYADMENYNPNDAACRTAVLAYLSAFTKRLHYVGYLSGAYANLGTGAKHLSDVYGSTSYARPDALWLARWDGSTSLKGWAGIADNKWAVHQRAKQYRGDHNETYGGVTINIDSDYVDAPVATVALPYKITSSSALNGRQGPSTSYAVTRTYSPGSTVRVVCQVSGQKVGTTTVWDKLSNGDYVTDYYVSTPSNTGFSSPLPRCQYPYQTKNDLNMRSGPGTSYALKGVIPSGGLVWIQCQKSGSKVGTSAVWDKHEDGTYVADYYVATPSNTTFSAPLLRC